MIQSYEITDYNWEKKWQIINGQILILKLVVSVMKFFILWIHLLKKRGDEFKNNFNNDILC